MLEGKLSRRRTGKGLSFAGCVRVLLVEDNLINQQIAVELLHRQNVYVEVVGNGLLAVERIEAVPPDILPYDAILMDVHMPVMDGFEATKRIRQCNQEVPIIAMTARAMANEESFVFTSN